MYPALINSFKVKGIWNSAQNVSVLRQTLQIFASIVKDTVMIQTHFQYIRYFLKLFIGYESKFSIR